MEIQRVLSNFVLKQRVCKGKKAVICPIIVTGTEKKSKCRYKREKENPAAQG